MSDKMRKVLQEMVAMMDRGEEPGAGSNWHRAALEALAEQPAQGKAVEGAERRAILWEKLHDKRVEELRERDAKIAKLTAPPSPAVPDDVAKDAARWRFCETYPGWLRQVRKGKAMWFAFASPTTNYEFDIYRTAVEAIDAAMLAAAPARKS